MIDSFSITLALGPLAVYLLVIGLMHTARHPIVTTGAQDTAAMGIGLIGILMVGPLNLFFPNMAYGMLGWIVWVMLAAFFLLTLLLIILTMRPRMVIYGTTATHVRQPLLHAAKTLDADARLEGEQIWFPSVNAGVRIEVFSPTDVPQIVPQSQHMSPVFWRRLILGLRSELATETNPSRTRGAGLVFIGLLMLGLVAIQIATEPQEIVAGFREWLRL